MALGTQLSDLQKKYNMKLDNTSSQDDFVANMIKKQTDPTWQSSGRDLTQTYNDLTKFGMADTQIPKGGTNDNFVGTYGQRAAAYNPFVQYVNAGNDPNNWYKYLGGQNPTGFKPNIPEGQRWYPDNTTNQNQSPEASASANQGSAVTGEGNKSKPATGDKLIAQIYPSAASSNTIADNQPYVNRNWQPPASAPGAYDSSTTITDGYPYVNKNWQPSANVSGTYTSQRYDDNIGAGTPTNPPSIESGPSPKTPPLFKTRERDLPTPPDSSDDTIFSELRTPMGEDRLSKNPPQPIVRDRTVPTPPDTSDTNPPLGTPRVGNRNYDPNSDSTSTDSSGRKGATPSTTNRLTDTTTTPDTPIVTGSGGNSTTTPTYPGAGMLDTLLKWYSKGTGAQDWANNEISALVEQLRGAQHTSSEQLANALAAKGITGGQASDALAQLERDYGLGLGQGSSDIRSEALQLKNENQGKLMDALLQLENLKETGRQNTLEYQIAMRNLDQALQKNTWDYQTAQRGLDQQHETDTWAHQDRVAETEAKLKQIDLDKLLGLGKLSNEALSLQLQSQLGYDQLGLDTRKANMTMATDLLQIALSADTADRAAIMQLVNLLLGYDSEIEGA